MTTCLGNIWFIVRAFRELFSINVYTSFPHIVNGGIWDLIVSFPDHCLSFYFIRWELFHFYFAFFLNGDEEKKIFSLKRKSFILQCSQHEVRNVVFL